MGTWVITIEGCGPHHNGKEEIDADILAHKVVQQLQGMGQSIYRASFTLTGGSENLNIPQPLNIPSQG